MWLCCRLIWNTILQISRERKCDEERAWKKLYNHVWTYAHIWTFAQSARLFILLMEWWQDNVNVSSGKHVNLYPLIFYYLRYIFPFIIKLQGASFYVSFTFYGMKEWYSVVKMFEWLEYILRSKLCNRTIIFRRIFINSNLIQLFNIFLKYVL